MKLVDHCPSCKSENRTDFLIRKINLCRCSKCGLVFLPTIPNNLITMYKEDSFSSPTSYYEASRSIDEIVSNERLSRLEHFSRKEALLDIGCNVGTFLGVARDRGWRSVVGIEPNLHAANVCENNGLTVINKPYSPDIVSKLNQRFSAIVLTDVIEHLENLTELMSTIGELLTDDGVILVVTPNFSSIVARLLQIKPREHLIYFDKASLTNLFERYHFETLVLEETSRPRAIGALAIGTTFSTNLGKSIPRLVSILRLQALANLILTTFVRDELFLISRKNSITTST